MISILLDGNHLQDKPRIPERCVTWAHLRKLWQTVGLGTPKQAMNKMIKIKYCQLLTSVSGMAVIPDIISLSKAAKTNSFICLAVGHMDIEIHCCMVLNVLQTHMWHYLQYLTRSRKVSALRTVVTEQRIRHEVTDDDEQHFENGRYGAAKILRSNIFVIVTWYSNVSPFVAHSAVTEYKQFESDISDDHGWSTRRDGVIWG